MEKTILNQALEIQAGLVEKAITCKALGIIENFDSSTRVSGKEEFTLRVEVNFYSCQEHYAWEAKMSKYDEDYKEGKLNNQDSEAMGEYLTGLINQAEQDAAAVLTIIGNYKN